ncbi:MAG: 16S rRNA (cytidine(1402)-2'-O)-methyltransferase [Bacteroidetes bacterium]|nr:MAG: 16S rRNA (cytidine(1402)-2'-O)-methyltransferase [Bacteroidota bacterium]
MSKLYIIPTPIGNLEDVTLRALRILKEVDYVLAEDTRTSRKFFNHYEIDTPLRAYHMHNEHSAMPAIMEALQNAESVALISDAGTPAISDPGFLLVREAIKNNVDVECLPGATAFVPALVNSGLPNEKFIFEGFLPHKKGRQGRILKMAEHEHSFILYESPHRLIKTLKQLAEFLEEDRQASISREISKMFEETKRGSLKELIEYFDKGKIRGEFVIIVAGKSKK